jgi:glycosyltransferase involved in cell wall biosynthesis
MPKVTIALITYNRISYLKQAIEAVLNQTYQDFELIIMDNGSTTQTFQLVEPYLNKQVIYHKNPNNNREYINEAFSMALGDYLLITHDDDMLKPTMLEKEVAEFEKNKNCMLVSCNTTLINEDDCIIKQKAYNKERNFTFKQFEYIKSFFDIDFSLYCPTVMLRKSFFITNKLKFRSDVGPAHDNYLWFETNLHPIDFIFIAEPLYNYRVHNNQDGRINSNTMELILYPKTIDLLIKKIGLEKAKPFLILISHKLALNLSFAYFKRKITKVEFKSMIAKIKIDLKTWNITTISSNLILFLILHFNTLFIYLHKIYVRFKKL